MSAPELSAAELAVIARFDAAPVLPEVCPTCNGARWNVRRAEWIRTRETVGMVCQTCGTDYAS